jgi:hypothetical protein
VLPQTYDLEDLTEIDQLLAVHFEHYHRQLCHSDFNTHYLPVTDCNHFCGYFYDAFDNITMNQR